MQKSARRDIVFLHVPKTGGTAVRNALVRALPDRRVLLDYGPHAAETSPEIRALVYREAVASVPSDFRRRIDDGRGILLVGHFRARRYWPHFHAESFVTVLRDPVERLVSEYNHLVRRRDLAQPLEEFAAVSRPRMLATLLRGVSPRRFGFIGFTDSLETDIARLSELVGRPVDLQRENEGTYDAGLAARLAEPAFRAEIARHIAEDEELYRRLRRGLSRRREPAAAGPADPADFAGRVRLAEGGTLVGFAVHRRIETILEVEILADGKVIDRVPADRHRPYLRTLRLARSGVGGFVVPLRRGPARWLKLAGRTRLTVRIAGTGVELAGSPIDLRAE